MEHLWSPWRLSYVTRAAHGEDDSAPGNNNPCIFCEPRGPNADLVVYDGRLCYVILNLYPYNNGHLMVVPRRHIRDLASTTAEERAELMALARVAEIALGEAYTPHGLNAGINLASAPYVTVIDADTVLEGNAVLAMMNAILPRPGETVAAGWGASTT